MGDLIRDNVGDVMTVVGALVVATITVATAEGGRRRRLLKRTHEGLEVLSAMRQLEFSPDRQDALVGQLERDLDEYVLTPAARTLRWLKRGYRTLIVFVGLYMLIDSVGALTQDEPLSDVSVVIVSGVILGAMAVVVLYVLLFMVWWLLVRKHVRAKGFSYVDQLWAQRRAAKRTRSEVLNDWSHTLRGWSERLSERALRDDRSDGSP